MPTPHHEIAVFGSSAIAAESAEWTDAVRCGQLLAEAGLAVATGGYGGVMEAVSLGAAGAGGRVTGVIAPHVFPTRPGANPHVAEIVEAASLTERIHLLIGRAAGFIVLPGSLGTLTELVVAWNEAYVAPLSGRRAAPIVAVGDAWRDVVGVLAETVGAQAELILLVESVDDAVAAIVARVVRPIEQQ